MVNHFTLNCCEEQDFLQMSTWSPDLKMFPLL